MRGVELRQVLVDGVAESRDFLISLLDGIERQDLVFDLQPFLAVQALQSEYFLVAEVAEQRVVGGNHFLIQHRLEQLVVGCHRVGIAVVPLLRAGGGKSWHNPGAEITLIDGRQGHFHMTERGGEQLRQLEIDGRPLDVAQDVTPGLVSAHAAGVGIMPAAGNAHGDAVEHGHVFFVCLERAEPFGEFVFVEIDIEGLFLGVFFPFFGGEGGQGELLAEVAVGFADENEAVGESFGRGRGGGGNGCGPEVVEGRREGEAQGAEGGGFEEFAAMDVHGFSCCWYETGMFGIFTTNGHE